MKILGLFALVVVFALAPLAAGGAIVEEKEKDERALYSENDFVHTEDWYGARVEENEEYCVVRPWYDDSIRYYRDGSLCGYWKTHYPHGRDLHKISVCCEIEEGVRREDDAEFECVECGQCDFPQEVFDACCALAKDHGDDRIGRSGYYDFGSCPDNTPVCCKCGPGNDEYSFACIRHGEECDERKCPTRPSSSSTLTETDSTSTSSTTTDSTSTASTSTETDSSTSLTSTTSTSSTSSTSTTSSTTSTTSTSTTKTCPPNQSLCGDSCCLASEACFGAICCSFGSIGCGDTCCNRGESCNSGADPPFCCPIPKFVCGDSCCNPLESCFDTNGDGILQCVPCLPLGAECTAGVFCCGFGSNVDCLSDKCCVLPTAPCDPNSTEPDQCCTPGELCLDDEFGSPICCPLDSQCSDTCCPLGESCSVVDGTPTCTSSTSTSSTTSTTSTSTTTTCRPLGAFCRDADSCCGFGSSSGVSCQVVASPTTVCCGNPGYGPCNPDFFFSEECCTGICVGGICQ